MSTELVDLSHGGVVAVLLGQGAVMPDGYNEKPQVISIDTTKLDNANLRQQILPSNCRVAVITESIPRNVYQVVNAEIRNRRITYIVRKSTGGIQQFLEQVLAPINNGIQGPVPVSSLEVKPATMAARGAIKALVERADFTQGQTVAAEARRLFEIAKAEGIHTTVNSIAQGLSKYKREHRLGERPKSAMAPQMLALKILDEAIASLTSIRDYVSKVEAENAELRRRDEAAKKLFGFPG